METPAETSRQLSRLTRGLASFCATMVNVFSLLFLFYVVPEVATVIGKDNADSTSFLTQLFIELAQLSQGHKMIGITIFMALIIWNGWAIFQTDSKLRKKAWLILAGVSFCSMALVVLTGKCILDEVMISDTPPQTVIETVTLPTGEVVMNESKSDDAGSSNNLFYQANASAPYESLGEIDLMFSSISLHKSKPFILKGGNHEALVIGDYVFERSAQKGGRYWLVKDTKPDFVAEALLRNFILPNGPAQYVFDHLDLDQNVLVTRLKLPKLTKAEAREEHAAQQKSQSAFPNPTYPKYLVYSAPQYGLPLTFDFQRTGALNGLPLPNDKLSMDVSVVTFPGDTSRLLGRDRAAALAEPGAKEIFAKTFPLNGETWTKIEYATRLSPTITENSQFEAILGFNDPAPHRVNIFWRREPDQQADWHPTETGAWVVADVSGLEGGILRNVYFRVEGM